MIGEGVFDNSLRSRGRTRRGCGRGVIRVKSLHSLVEGAAAMLEKRKPAFTGT